MNDFATLYQRYSLDVYRFALSLSGNAAQAEDIASETFARAWLAPAELRLGTVKAYLLTIARHLFLKGLRREARQVELDDRLPDPALGLSLTAVKVKIHRARLRLAKSRTSDHEASDADHA